MNDALGQPQSVLLLGGTSEIGRAVVRALPRGRLRRVVLAGRPSARLDRCARDLAAELPADVAVRPFDACDTGSHGALVDEVFDGGDVDIVIVAFGVLGEQSAAEREPEQAVHVAQVNYVGAVSVMLHVAQRLRAQGHGNLVVLSSVAGDRPRRSNFVYGSTKSGLDAFARGVGDALAASGAHVLVVRPGFVRTRMTAGLEQAPMTVEPADVADAVVDALRARKRIVYVPRQLAMVMSVLRATPHAVFRRLPI